MPSPLSLRDEAIRAAAKAMAGGTGAWGGLYAEDAAQAVDAVLGVLTTRIQQLRPSGKGYEAAYYEALDDVLGVVAPQDSAAACPPTRHGSVSVVGKPVAPEASGVQTGDGPSGGAAADQLGESPATPEPPASIALAATIEAIVEQGGPHVWAHVENECAHALRAARSLPTHDQEQP